MGRSLASDPPARAPAAELHAAAAPSARLASLDAFRGMTIAAMILVNNPGAARVYAPLSHAEWHGWTPTDLIFPFFVLIVGVSIVIARPKPVPVILRRGAVLWLLGLFMAGYPFVTLRDGLAWRESVTNLRIMGVLPRLGICYVAAALLHRRLATRALVAVVIGILLAYWLALAGFGHLDSKTENLEAQIDRRVLGAHVWSGSRAHGYDPEGILSTLPAIATCLLGVLAGRVLRQASTAEQSTLLLFVIGTPLVIAGYAWGWVFPINKQLWTSSYVLLTAGQAYCALAVCHWLCDARGHRAWAKPFVIYGVNAIAVFVGSGLLARTFSTVLAWQGPNGKPTSLSRWLYEHAFASWLAPLNASLAYALAWVAFWFGVLWLLWRRGLVLRV